ncbi:MAG: hypothetical protein KC468_36345 [Myxococcales bacterium]|nr:hypothetical protein [Myxococcales bacterium]
MKRSRTALIVTLAAALAGGCAHARASKRSIKKGATTALTQEAEVRQTYFASRDDGTPHVCAEPPPDVALNRVIEAELKRSRKGTVKYKDVDVVNERGLEGELSRSTTALALAGRSPAVLMARELMYRLCEFSMNAAASSSTGETGELSTANKEILQAYKDVASAVLQQATADKLKAAAELNKYEIRATALVAKMRTELEIVLEYVAPDGKTVDAKKLQELLKDPSMASFHYNDLLTVRDAATLAKHLEGKLELVEKLAAAAKKAAEIAAEKQPDQPKTGNTANNTDNTTNNKPSARG